MSRNKRHPRKWGEGSFVALPVAVLKSEKISQLSPIACKLLFEFLRQYGEQSGMNNGDLGAALKTLSPRGWTSSSNLNKAIKELLNSGFIVIAEQGGRNKPSLYALSFYAVDECMDKWGHSKHSLKPSSKPSNEWLKDEPILNMEEARKRKKRLRVVELRDYIKKHPENKYVPNMERGIQELERSLEIKNAAPRVE